MKYHNKYDVLFKCRNENEVFDFLISTLSKTNRYWEFFVDWGKVKTNIEEFEMDLNTLNYLIGKQDIEEQFCNLLNSHPSIIRTIPILIACRDEVFEILTDYPPEFLISEMYELIEKPSLEQEDIQKVCEFAEKTGILKLFRDKCIKSVPDYVFGVEVGLDSNARKNRSGKVMEEIILKYVNDICEIHNHQWIKEATSSKIAEQWEINLKVDKTNRKFDFAILTDKNLNLIEVNYYSGGGSKLKSTAGEYKSLSRFVVEQGHRFIWITDGQGWSTTKHSLEETFHEIEYTLNLNMMHSGLLEKIILEEI